MSTAKTIKLLSILWKTALVVLTLGLFYGLGIWKAARSLELNERIRTYETLLAEKGEAPSDVHHFLYKEAKRQKWKSTFYMIAMHALLSGIFLALFFKHWPLIWITKMIYAGLVLVAALFLGIGYVFGGFDTGYPIAHRITEILQSPLIALVLLLGYYYYKQRQSA